MFDFCTQHRQVNQLNFSWQVVLVVFYHFQFNIFFYLVLINVKFIVFQINRINSDIQIFKRYKLIGRKQTGLKTKTVGKTIRGKQWNN